MEKKAAAQYIKDASTEDLAAALASLSSEERQKLGASLDRKPEEQATENKGEEKNEKEDEQEG